MSLGTCSLGLSGSGVFSLSMNSLKSSLLALTNRLPTQFRDTLYVRAFGLFKIPLVLYISPTVVELSGKRTEIKVPLNWRTQNHLKSMYFGALCTAADLACGLVAVKLIYESGRKIDFVFKDFEAQFLKRVEGDAHFVCEAGDLAEQAVQKAISTGERQNIKLPVVATVPSKMGNEPVAKFSLTLSMKLRK